MDLKRAFSLQKVPQDMIEYRQQNGLKRGRQARKGSNMEDSTLKEVGETAPP
jgi:hypothetical protein